GEFIEAECGGGIPTAGLSEIAPETQAFAKGANIEPAVVVVIKQLQFRDCEAVERNMEMLAGFWINYFNLSWGGEHQIHFQIVIQIAGRDRFRSGPVRRSVSYRQGTAALFE